VPQWDEQYLCIGYKEVFLIKCRVLQKDIKGKEPKRGDDDAGGDGRREAEIDSDSEENADHMPPVIIFRFPYVAIQSVCQTLWSRMFWIDAVKTHFISTFC
jgi:hypothetical protein